MKKWIHLFFTFSIAFVCASVMLFNSHVKAAGTFTTYTYNSREYKLYVPSGTQSGVEYPLVVMLHGCTQDPDQFATGTQMNVLAESEHFFVMYPKQTTAANSNVCWNWFDPNHQSRGSGEPALITGMVNQVKATYNINNEEVYVAGLSAGAAMSVILGVTYPDVFKAISIGSGLEYKAATSMINAFTAMSSGGPSPTQQGQVAYQAMPTPKTVVPTIVFHGTSDYTVATVNGNQVLTQWATTNDLADDGSLNHTIDDVADVTETGQVPGGLSYTHYTYFDQANQTILEKYLITNMGHAWSGGSSQGSYTAPTGPNQSLITWEFFHSRTQNESDTVAPTTTISPQGGTYYQPISVTLTPNEPAVTYYTLDGSTPSTSSSIYQTPIQISQSTVIKYFSIDAAENSELIKTATYIFDSSQDTTSPVTTVNPTGGNFTDSVTITLSTNEQATTYYTLDGTTPTTNSLIYSSPIQLTDSAILKFFSVDLANNYETVKTESYTISQPSLEILTSIDSEDGYAGIYYSYGAGTAVKAGDIGMYNSDTYRAIVSFNTSQIQVVDFQSVTLRLYVKSITGTISQLRLDIKSGYFGTSSALSQSDYSALPSASAICTITNVTSTYIDFQIPMSSFTYINLYGKTQFKITATTSYNFASDIIEFYGGSDGDYAPQLIIQ